MSALAERLARVASRSTLRLTHHGRKSGTPYEVVIWFVVEGEQVFLGTASARRQWVKNVQRRPDVRLAVDGQTFTGTAERVGAPADVRHVTDLLAAKYWYLWPMLAIARLFGFDPAPDATFRVHVDAD
jgi:deazaflavin-dependent oxidoreductase (nitroreductase family)